jgi:hypothetical protein
MRRSIKNEWIGLLLSAERIQPLCNEDMALIALAGQTAVALKTPAW